MSIQGEKEQLIMKSFERRAWSAASECAGRIDARDDLEETEEIDC